MSYNTRTRKAVQGAGELLDALANTDLKSKDIEQKKLPSELQGLSRAELDQHIAKARNERSALQKEISEVTQKRDSYLQAENKRLAAAGKADGFDEAVAQIIRQQGEKKGIHY